MAGVSDRIFRTLAREHGAALAPSEMVATDPQLRGSQKTRQRMNHLGEPGPISIQLLGADPKHMAAAARYSVDQGAHLIDINMGCPAKKVCNKSAGSALMQNEKLVEDIIKSVVNAVNIPVTLKMRTGWNEENKNAPTIAKIAEDNGIKMLAIHGRTRAQKYNGDAEYDTVKKIKGIVSIPVVANGDITSAEKAKKVLDYTGADAVMLGRATQGNPWLVGQINNYLTTGKISKAPLLDKKISLILKHILQIHDFYGHKMGTQLSRKHIFWYSIHLDQEKGSAFWPNINRVSDHSEQYLKFHDFLYSI